jgi:trigger factor
MTPPTLEHIAGSKVKMVFRVTPEEAQPYLDEAVRALGESKPVPGFRPGKAPYAEVVKQHGEMRIWETALERIVRSSYLKTVLDLDIDTVGSPEVQVDKLTPGQEIGFTVIAPIAPTVKTLAAYDKELVEFKPHEVSDEDIEKAITDLRRMQRKEVLSTEAATKEDLVVIDLDMKKDHVVLEGGTGRDYRIYLAEDNYIPGFSEKLVGIKPGEERTFTLKFPEGHYQKHLSGQDVDFTAKAKSVFTLELPALDETFAKSLGQESIQGLKDILKKNIGAEEEDRARQKSEVELLEKLVDQSSFSDVPEILVNDEVRKMLAELEHGVEEQGMKMEDYLVSIKKTKDELRLGFVEQAMRRIKAATLIKEIAKRENIAVSEDELDTEVDRILATVKPEDVATRERVISPEYREYVSILMRNQKTLELLKKKGIKGYTAPSAHEHDHDHSNCDHDHDHEGHGRE